MSPPTNRNPQKSEAGKNYPFFEVQEICGVRITDIAQSHGSSTGDFNS